MIQLFGVTKTFGNGTSAADRVLALDGVTLSIQRADLLLLTGASGAGKSTLLRMIFAAERPDRGQIIIAGRNIARLRSTSIPYLRRNIGVIFQDFKLLTHLSAAENVAIALEIRNLGRREVRRRALAALDAVGLIDRCDMPVNVLSGGEQQRIAVARAVVGRPAIVLADEPTGNLDPNWSRDLLALLAKIAHHGTSVVIATHDPMVMEGADYSQHIHLEKGRVASVTAMRSDYARPAMRVVL